MNNDYPYLECIRIARECRNVLVKDTLEANSPDLYDALYSNSESQIHRIKLELYEVKWIALHWEKISEIIENRSCSMSEKKKLMSVFAKWHRGFVSNWNYDEFSSDGFESALKDIYEKKINVLAALISIDSKWEQSLKEIKILFKREEKILNKKMQAFKEGL